VCEAMERKAKISEEKDSWSENLFPTNSYSAIFL
jgi:hypothetical protein